MKRILVAVVLVAVLLFSSASRQSLEQWFKQHSDIAQETRKARENVQPIADANWGDTAEGFARPPRVRCSSTQSL